MDLMGIWRSLSVGVGCARRCALLAGITLVLVGIASGRLAALARAEECSTATEQIREEQVYASRLPDCRAYEQVSPVNKNGVDAVGEPSIVQASPSGDSVSFFAITPFSGTAGSAGIPTYLGVRSSDNEAWSTEGLQPEAAPGSVNKVVGLTKDLGKAIISAGEPVLAPGAMAGTNNAYISVTAFPSPYQLLAPGIGLFNEFSFTDATQGDSHILFETKAKLTTSAEPMVNNLYEWDEARPPLERVSLVGVLPDGKAPTEGSFAGAGGPGVAPKMGGSAQEFYTQNTISRDGAHVFFSDRETGHIYMRDPQTEPAVTIPVSKGQAYWRAATPDGSYVVYTEGNELYRFSVNENKEEALTSGAEGILGVLGISDDGSYVYFVAPGKLATTDDDNSNGEEAETGAANLYEWHEDTATHATSTTFIARLLSGVPGDTRDESNWRGYAAVLSEASGPSGGEKSSRVTSDGKILLFSSTSRLTVYDNNGELEFYLYDAGRPLSTSNPVCVSCNPQRALATSSAHLTSTNKALSTFPGPRNAFLTRNLSSDGSRVFFQTEEALVPGDTNGQLDVYEWKRGACEHASEDSSASSIGCLYLISTGQNESQSYFGDASEDGSNVFFFTRQSLVSQDRDNNSDMYDARINGGMMAQNPLPPSEPCTGEGCRGVSSGSPVFGVPTSAAFSGVGNFPPAAPVKPRVAAKPLTRAQKLARALKACERKRGKRGRAVCERSARKKFGSRRTASSRSRS